MALTDRGDRFGGLSIFNHWLLAAAVIAMLAFGLYIEDLPKSEEAGALIGLHKSVGILVLFLALWRIVWRLLSGFPEDVARMRPWERFCARAMHYALMILVLAMPLSGYVASSAGGHPVSFFGWFSLPALPQHKALAAAAGETHEAVATLLMVLIGLHVLAALKHHVLDRDATLKRMLGRAG